MSTADQLDDALYRACIVWDVPAILRSGSEEAVDFLRTLQLLPIAFADVDLDVRAQRMSPLRRATFGLQAELTGEPELAKELYAKVARQPGLRGLLGLLLLAWTSDAERLVFDRVEKRLAGLSGPRSRDLAARCYCKLAGWALDRGWQDLAAHHYERARATAGADLRRQLDEIGNWFGADQTIRFGAQRGNLIAFPWIRTWADRAACKSIEDQFKRTFRSPWTRTWTFGSSSAEGADIQSAELQASWAGAMWLLPAIQREHAALLLAQSRDPEDVVRGIALWIRGGGATPGRLIDSFEGHLSRESVAALLVTQLHEGRSVSQIGQWWESCLALWSELPPRVVDSLIASFQTPSDDLGPHDPAVTGVRLFAHLLPQSERATIRALEMSDRQIAVLLRVTTPGLVDRLHPSIVKRGVVGALADDDDPWRHKGFPAVVRAWSRLPTGAAAEIRSQVAERTPSHEVAEASMLAPGLLDRSVIANSLDEAVTRVEQDLRNARDGQFSGRSFEPATHIVWLVSALGESGPEATAILVRQASSQAAAPVQRQAALAALIALAREDLLGGDIAAALVEVDGSAHPFMADDEKDARRYEDVQRAALGIALSYNENVDGRLLAASRDSSTRVRALAVSTVTWLTTRGSSSGALDATLLGALYDPHPRVQAMAVPALWRGRFASEVIRDAAQLRVLELWPTAHLDLRIAVAHEAAAAAVMDDRISVLRASSRGDRSVLVRWAADEAGASSR